MKESQLREVLGQPGVMELLAVISDGPRYMTSLKRSEINPSGVGSYEVIKRATETLVRLGWAVENRESRRIYLQISPKGQKVLDCVRSNLA